MKHAPKNPREADNLFRPIAKSITQSGSHRTYRFDDGGILTVTQRNGEFGPKAKRQIMRLAVFYGLLALVLVAGILLLAERMIA